MQAIYGYQKHGVTITSETERQNSVYAKQMSGMLSINDSNL